MGFKDGYKGFKCYNPETNEYIISRDIIFNETEFPGIDWQDKDKEFIPISGDIIVVPGPFAGAGGGGGGPSSPGSTINPTKRKR